MPKRSYEEDPDAYFRKKIKKIEKKLKKRNKKRRRLSSSSSASSTDMTNASLLEDTQESQLSNETPETAQFLIEPEIDLNHEPAPSTSQPSQDEPELEEEILSLMGETPSKDKKYGAPIQKDLAIRLEPLSTCGLPIKVKDELLERYITPDNCKKIEDPLLNPEVKAALSEWLLKKDKALENKQKQLAASISVLSQALSKVIASEQKDPELIKLLLDATKIMCDSQHNKSVTRRNFICTSIKKELKDQLETTEIDKFLFSEQLSDTLKAAKAINKSVNEIKNTPPSSFRPVSQRNKASFPKNFKSQLPNSRPPVAPRRQQMPAPSNWRAPPPPPAPRRKPPPPPPPQRYYSRPPPRR